MGMTIALLLVLGIVFRAMTPEERARLIRTTLSLIHPWKDAAMRGRLECEPFRDALRARTRWAFVTPTLVLVNVTIFVYLSSGAGAVDDSEMLLRWGGNFGPRTTNGEWWRLVTSMFVHSQLVHLVVNVVALIQIGLILERLVGRFAFAAVYMAGGLFASLVSLSASPGAISAGASGAIFGLYGLLFASSIWGMVHRSSVTIPLVALKRLAPAAAVFTFYNMLNHRLEGEAELIGLLLGFFCGLVLVRRVSERTPPERLVTTAIATTAVIVMACAVPLAGVTDVRPELDRIVAIEQRTAGAYQSAVERFRDGRVTAEMLAQLIERTIVPELQAADVRLKTLDRVPLEHQPLIASAEEYLKLRSQSWRLRAEGLRERPAIGRMSAERQFRTSQVRRGKAEEAERSSLELLQRIAPAEQKN